MGRLLRGHNTQLRGASAARFVAVEASAERGIEPVDQGAVAERPAGALAGAQALKGKVL
jgi:hypothetical protein